MASSAEPSGGGGDAEATERRLRELCALGYQFVHPTDAEGAVRAVVGVRVHDTVIDVVKLHAEDDVITTRMPAGEADILAPSKVLWQCSGQVVRVLDELLALPDEAPDHAVSPQATGCWVPVRPGAAKWVTATTAAASSGPMAARDVGSPTLRG